MKRLVMNIIILTALRARAAKPYHLITGGYGPDMVLKKAAERLPTAHHCKHKNTKTTPARLYSIFLM